MTIAWTDPEALLISYLGAALAAHGLPGISVATTAPRGRDGSQATPRDAVTVSVAGGTTHATWAALDNPTVIVEAWSSTGAKASALAGVLRSILHASPGDPASGIYRTREISRPQSLPDPATQAARYTQTWTVGIRGHQTSTP